MILTVSPKRFSISIGPPFNFNFLCLLRLSWHFFLVFFELVFRVDRFPRSVHYRVHVNGRHPREFRMHTSKSRRSVNVRWYNSFGCENFLRSLWVSKLLMRNLCVNSCRNIFEWCIFEWKNPTTKVSGWEIFEWRIFERKIGEKSSIPYLCDSVSFRSCVFDLVSVGVHFCLVPFRLLPCLDWWIFDRKIVEELLVAFSDWKNSTTKNL